MKKFYSWPICTYWPVSTAQLKVPPRNWKFKNIIFFLLIVRMAACSPAFTAYLVAVSRYTLGYSISKFVQYIIYCPVERPRPYGPRPRHRAIYYVLASFSYYILYIYTRLRRHVKITNAHCNYFVIFLMKDNVVRDGLTGIIYTFC